MKAAVLHAVDDLRVETVPDPTAGKNETIVRVQSCGVCSSDVHRVVRDGTYHFPTIPGHEYSALDEDGRLVAVYPLIPCYECEQCRAGRFQCCTSYDYTGSRCDGGFAELVRVPRANLVPVPEGVSAREAAMTEPAAVGMHAMRVAGMQAGETVAVIGCGTIGLIAAQVARALGAARVVPIDISDERLAVARSLGFNETANSRDDLAAALGAFADVVVEMVGLSVTYNLAIDLAKAGGSVVYTGNIAHDLQVPRKRVSSILRKELRVLGTWNSTALGDGPTDWQEIMRLQAEGKVDLKPLITHDISLEELPDTIHRMAAGTEVFGKVMVNVNKE
ncbi:MAG: zinc-binding dehydrogenase [Chitinivibrionales bacterium]|nr:zinc-binding dehydrogenase [Chitinivibrionales bacterium]